MNYQIRKKERNLNKNLIKIYNTFKIKSLNLDFASKIILIGFIILSISLFVPWLIKGTNKSEIYWNSFNSIGGNLGYITIVLIIVGVFILFFNNTGEKLKLASNLNFKNYTILIFSSIFIITSSIVYISFIRGLNIFFEDIQIGKGIILYLLGGIVILIGALIKRKIYYKNEYKTYIYESHKTDYDNIEKHNMKLPF